VPFLSQFAFYISLSLSVFCNYFVYFPNAYCFLSFLHMPPFFPLMSLFLVISSLSLVPLLFRFSFYVSISVCHPNFLFFLPPFFPQWLQKGPGEGPMCCRAGAMAPVPDGLQLWTRAAQVGPVR